MKVCDVYIEYSNNKLDKPYTYICENLSLSCGQRVYVEFNHKVIVGFVVKVYEKEILDFKYKLSEIIEIIDDKPLLNDESFKIANFMSYRYCAPLISCLNTMLPSALKTKSNHKKIKKSFFVIFLEKKELKGIKQIEAQEYLDKNKKVERSVFNKKFSCLNRLIELGVCEVIEEETKATSNELLITDNDFILNQSQINAVEKIKNSDNLITLLHGVTGSGKTEVFLEVAETYLLKNKQVLILVPEISLTPQMVKRVKTRFNNIAIYHSGLNNQEKYEQFCLVRDNKVNIVVGTRSAVFMPFSNLGLIVMDEEHDLSYKQDSVPMYHTRDIVLFRSNYHNAKVILSSATPSLETYARAYKQKYFLVKMNNRINNNQPDIEIIDMRNCIKNDNDYLISDKLENKIRERMLKKEQVILMLNRRGYTPVLRCMTCGEIIKCKHCDLALNYHKTTNSLVCHTCGYTIKNTGKCVKCGSDKLRYIGIGTQKLEEHIKNKFPNANILRVDADTTRKKNAHDKLFESFKNNEYDIMIGTQMIAKGLDFPNVTLVGVLNGDAFLTKSDYRSSEMTYDLLAQASGRSGRGEKKGEVLIQAYNVDHYVINAVKNNNYFDFFKNEMFYRHQCNYPPYSYISEIIIANKNKVILLEEVSEIKRIIVSSKYKVLGPVELLRKFDEYRYRIVIKSKDEEFMIKKLNELKEYVLNRKVKSKVNININPMVME